MNDFDDNTPDAQYVDGLACEVQRLRAGNTDLLAALESAMHELSTGANRIANVHRLLARELDDAASRARSAIARAREGASGEKAGLTQAAVISSEPLSTDAAKEEDRMREALEKISAERECGCWPVHQCNSQQALRIIVDEYQDIARAALLPAGEKD